MATFPIFNVYHTPRVCTSHNPSHFSRSHTRRLTDMSDTGVVVDEKISKMLTKDLIIILKTLVNCCPPSEYDALIPVIREYTLGKSPNGVLQVLDVAWKICIRHKFVAIQQDLRCLIQSFREEYRKMQQALAAQLALVKENQEKCVAVVMGSHGRLGAQSFFHNVDPEILRMIIASAGLRDCAYLQ